MSNTRAKAGGEYGVNGEFYQGGQFLPSSPTTEKGKYTRKQIKSSSSGRKWEIESYKWEYAPTETARPVKAAMTFCMPLRDDDDNFINKYERYEPAIKGSLKNEMYNGWHIDELIKMYNDGERWFEPR